MTPAYLGLGSNVGDRRENLEAAVRALPEHGVSVAASSSVYETQPVGLVLDQRDFRQHLVGGHAGGAPGTAARFDVLQHRLEPVEGPGEPRLQACPFLEFIPELTQAASLVGRQQPEQPIGGGELGRLLPGLLGRWRIGR